MNRIKKIILHIFTILLCLSMENIVYGKVVVSTQSDEETWNAGSHNYDFAWADVVNSYLVDKGNGTLMRVEYDENNEYIIIEEYNQDFVMINTRHIQMELPVFGGFYESEDYYFIICGQYNLEESDDVEVYRIIKYDKQWNRLDALSLKDENTTKPFYGGSLRCADYDGILYIRTCHVRYASWDGLNHQSNKSFCVDMEKMELCDTSVDFGYVSHSFNQFVILDNGVYAALDHGDAYPRGAVIHRYGNGANHDISKYKLSVVNYAGESGDNITNATIGGFEVSDTSYITVGTSGLQEGVDEYEEQYIYITATNKKNLSAKDHIYTLLTDEPVGKLNRNVSTPFLVKIDNNTFMVLWQSKELVNRVKFFMLDGKGNITSEVKTVAGILSDCQPIVSDGKIIWYTTIGSYPAFFTIDASGEITEEDLQEMPYDYGKLGEDIFWTLDDTKRTMNIYGIGRIQDYNSENIPYFNSELVEKIIMEDGITYIGENAFANLYHIKEIEIPGSVKQIATNAFLINSSYLIKGEVGSVAHKFAVEHYMNFQSTNGVWGDADKNGKVELSDAQMVLKIALKIETADAERKCCMDTDFDGGIMLNDAQRILKAALKIEAL